MDSERLLVNKQGKTQGEGGGAGGAGGEVKWWASTTAVMVMVCVAVFTDIFMFGVTLPIQGRLLERVGYPGDEEKLAFVFAAYSAGYLSFTPIIGITSDLLNDRKRPFITAFIALICSCFLFAFGQTYYMLVGARFLQGVAAAGTWVLGFTMLSDVFPNKILGEKIGIVFGANMVGFILGPIVGGVLSQYVSLQAPFFLCMGLGAVDITIRIIVSPTTTLDQDEEDENVVEDEETLLRKIQRQQEKQKQQVSLRHSLPRLLQSVRVWSLLFAIFISAASFSVVEARMPNHLKARFNYSEARNSIIFTVFIGARTLTGMILGKVPHTMRTRMMATGLILHGLAGPWPFEARTVPVLICTAVLFGFTYACAGIPAIPELARAIKSTGAGLEFGSTYAIYNIIYSLGMMFGPFFIATLHAAPFSLPLFYSLSTLACIVILFGLLFAVVNRSRLSSRYRSASMSSIHSVVKNDDEVFSSLTKSTGK